jgi:hypothetical protein
MKSNHRLKYLVLILVAFVVLPLSVISQSIEGDWYGKAEIQGIVLRLTVHVSSGEKGYSSTWDSPDQGAFGIASTSSRV